MTNIEEILEKIEQKLEEKDLSYKALSDQLELLAEKLIKKEDHAKWQSIDFSEWLSNNRWSFNKEDRFWYVFGTTKEELGSTLYDFFCWMNDEINPFIKLENGRYCQACGNSTTWSYDELFEMFKENNHE